MSDGVPDKPRTLPELIDALIIGAIRHGARPVDPLAFIELQEIDAQIGAECRLRGIEIPQLRGEAHGLQITYFGFTGVPLVQSATDGRIVLMPGTNWQQAMRGLKQIALRSMPKATEDDTTSDRPKKIKKKRSMTIAAVDCARLFRKAKQRDPGTRMQQIVESYVDDHGGSVHSILRILTDNPEHWKPDQAT